MDDNARNDPDMTITEEKLRWEDENGWHCADLDVSETIVPKDGRAICKWVKRCVKCSKLFPVDALRKLRQHTIHGRPH